MNNSNNRYFIIAFVFLLVLNCLPLRSISQIKANIINSVSKEPVPYATVEAIYINKSKRFYISDSNGTLEIDSSKVQSIRVTRTGYTFLETDLSSARLVGWVFELFPRDQTLEAIEVKAKRPIVESDASKISYDVSRDSTLKNKTAAQAIARLPFVSVDATNNVSYKNGQSFVVFVNGRRFSLLSNNPSTALKVIPTSMIKSVELIFDPPLEYKLQGYTAVIQITTLPGYYKGLLGSFGGSISSMIEWESEPYVSFQSNQTNLQFTYYHRGYNLNKSQISRYIVDASNEETQQATSYNSKANAGRLGVSIDQRLGLNSRIGVSATYYSSTFNDDGNSMITVVKPGSSFSIEGESALEGQKKYIDISSDFSKKYDIANSFSIIYRYLSESSLSTSWNNQNAHSRNRLMQKPTELSTQISNVIAINKQLTLESVLKLTSRKVSTLYVNDTMKGNSWYSKIPEVPNRLTFKIATLTNTLAYRTKKVSLRAGLSVDYTNYDIEGSNTTYSTDAFNLLPVITARRLIGKDKFLNITYRTRLYRPTYESLASVVPNLDPLIISVGNPRLGMQLEQQVATEYSFYFAKGASSAYFTLEYDFSNSYFNKYSSFDSSLNIRVIRYRQSKFRSFSFIVGGEFQYSPKWSSTGWISAGFIKLGDYFSEDPVISINQSVLYSINDKTGVHLLLGYKSKYINSMGYLAGYGTYDLNFSRYLMNQKLLVNLLVSNFFKKDRIQDELLRGDYFHIQNTYRQPFRAIQISLNFRFGQLKTFSMSNKKLSTNDIKKID